MWFFVSAQAPQEDEEEEEEEQKDKNEKNAENKEKKEVKKDTEVSNILSFFVKPLPPKKEPYSFPVYGPPQPFPGSGNILSWRLIMK